MKTEKLLALADHIEGTVHVEMPPREAALVVNKAEGAMEAFRHMGPGEVDFNMSGYLVERAPCGAVACVAGHALLLFGKEDPDPGSDASIHEEAAGILGLDEEEAVSLFALPGMIRGPDVSTVTPEEAARALRLTADGAAPEEAWCLALKEESE